MEDFILTYQPLIGSFLAILSSVFLWYIKHLFDKRQQLIQSEEEVKNIFLYAARESEEAVTNIVYYIGNVRESLKNIKSDEVHTFVTPKFSRVNLNEDRLFSIKLKLDTTTSQQIDIAMSSARAFNGFMDSFERGPEFIFDSTVRLISAGIESKEIALKGYNKSITNELNKLEAMTGHELLISQRHLLRPIVSIASKKSLKKFSVSELDDVLDKQAEILLSAIKKDLN